MMDKVNDLEIVMRTESIFTLERRRPFNSYYEAFWFSLRNTKVKTKMEKRFTLFEYLDYSIKYWPYRCGAVSIYDYLDSIGISIDTEKENDQLLILELLINLLYWAMILDSKEQSKLGLAGLDDELNVEKESKTCIENAIYFLEQCCNMQIRKAKTGSNSLPQYVISKRDAAVDVTVEAVPELSEYLLGYLDIRNKDNRVYKEAALTAIYKYLEKNKELYKGLSCDSLYDEFKACMNNFTIRHDTKNQVTISDSKRNHIYDNLFTIAIYVLQTKKANDIRNELKEIRCEQSPV